MQIGEASRLTGVSTKMIRHYEAIGLIPDADRRSSNYRDYDAEDVHRVRDVFHLLGAEVGEVHR